MFKRFQTCIPIRQKPETIPMVSGFSCSTYLNELRPERRAVPLCLKRESSCLCLPLSITGFFPAVLIVVSQLHQHPERAKFDARRFDPGLRLGRKGIPIGFHVGIFVFHDHHRAYCSRQQTDYVEFLYAIFSIFRSGLTVDFCKDTINNK